MRVRSEMGMVVVFGEGMAVVVGGFIGAVDMGVGVQMGMRMGVDGAAVAVFVGILAYIIAAIIIPRAPY